MDNINKFNTMNTPQTSIRLPVDLKAKINAEKGYKTLTGWIVEAIEEKFKQLKINERT